MWIGVLWAGLLVTRLKYPPLSRDRCSNTPVALVFSVASQTIAATPPLLSVKVCLSQSKDRPWRGGGVSQKKLAPEACHAIGGVA